MTAEQIAQKILDTLESQGFTNWHETTFEDYIGRYPKKHPKHLTKEQILEQITILFHLGDLTVTRDDGKKVAVCVPKK
jgi:hypothetical protein